MSVLIKDKTTGEWEQVAGNGRAEYGASTVRRGTIGVPAIAANVDYADQTITFSTPMPDADYLIDLSLQGSNTHRVAFHVVANTKTVNGFTVRFTPIGVKQITGVGVQGVADSLSYTLTVERDSTYPNLTKNTAIVDPTASLPNDWNAMQTGYLKNPMPANEATLVYTAFKLYTDTEYNQVLAALPPVDAVTDGNMKAVTSNAVYDAIAAFKRKADWSGIATKNYNNKTYFVPELYEATVGGSYAGIAYVLGECNGIALFGVNGADLSGFSHVDGSMYTVEPIVINNRSYFALRMSNDTDVDVGILVLGTSYS